MQIIITPRQPGDGVILALPMEQNIPNPDRADWKLVSCPVCGRGCWETELARRVMAMEPDLKAACTECALRAGMGKGE